MFSNGSTASRVVGRVAPCASAAEARGSRRAEQESGPDEQHHDGDGPQDRHQLPAEPGGRSPACPQASRPTASAAPKSAMESNRSPGLERERPPKRLVHVRRHFGPGGPHAGHRRGEAPHDEVVRRGPGERRRAGEHLVTGGGQRVLVGPGIDLPSPDDCSGAMYAGVPSACPVSVSCSRAACPPPRAIPKSATWVEPSSVSRRFSGFTSRWITPSLWA